MEVELNRCKSNLLSERATFERHESELERCKRELDELRSMEKKTRENVNCYFCSLEYLKIFFSILEYPPTSFS